MTRQWPFVALACFALSACQRGSPVPSTVTSAGAVAATLGDYAVGEPIRHANLTIFPILSKSPHLEDRFTTLAEGLKAGTVEIREVGAAARTPAEAAANRSDEGASEEVVPPAQSVGFGGSAESTGRNEVNRLVVINRGEKPLYLMPGEIIIGGSQDRTIGEETVIAATGEPVDIGVYCVEAGRWGARDAGVATAVFGAIDGTSYAAAMMENASAGRFVTTPGSLSKATRLAVQGAEGQGKVWESVGEANRASGVNWSSNAFTANYVDEEMIGRLTPYVDALQGPVSDQDRVVGVVVAVNGKIETVDLFESTPLFRKLWPQLLKSFALDALQVDDADEAKSTATLDKARTFLAGVMRDHSGEDRKTDGGLVVSKHETNDAVTFSAGAAMGGMGGGFGGAVHAAGFAK